MDTAKLNEVIDVANTVITAATELLNDAESEGKAHLFAEELDKAAQTFDELAEELSPGIVEEAPEEGEEEVAPEDAAQDDTLREWAGLPAKG